jgi:hypothetical protein
MDDALRRSWIRRLPIAGMAIPFLFAVAAQVVGPQPRPIAAAPARPSLAFDQYLVDLGAVGPSEEVFAHFDFTNRGPATIANVQLVPSCGCLQPRLNKASYEPGESGHFMVRVQTANEAAGQKEYSVAVKYADPEPRETIVVFRVVLPENQIFVAPRALVLFQEGGSSLPPQEIEITDRRGGHLNITRVDCTRDVARVELAGSEIDVNGNWHGHLKVTLPAKLPPGRVDAMIRIFTDDPDYHMLRVPLILQGPSARKIIDPHLRSASGTR